MKCTYIIEELYGVLNRFRILFELYVLAFWPVDFILVAF